MDTHKDRSSNAISSTARELSGPYFDAAPGLDRRSFLKLGVMGVVPLLAPGLIPVRDHAAALAPAALQQAAEQQGSPVATEKVTAAPAPFGRGTIWSRLAIREEPSAKSAQLGSIYRDDLIPLLGAVEGEPPWPTNAIWYQTEGGYIHSGYVQPVRDDPQTPILDVSGTGFWGQVSVPWAEARWAPAVGRAAFKLYYGTVYRVVRTVTGEDEQPWYQLQEGITDPRPGPYVPAYTLRRVTPEEMTPISPGHPDKKIVIDRKAQTLACMEGDAAVFSTRASTGRAGSTTPPGEFRVLYKRTTRRMTVQNIASPYDLPGVPFTVYFTWNGVAIHGTYWHNDYGRIHSNGCVNLTPADAQWVFRWAEPVVPYEVYTEHAEPREAGTRIVVL